MLPAPHPGHGEKFPCCLGIRTPPEAGQECYSIPALAPREVIPKPPVRRDGKTRVSIFPARASTGLPRHPIRDKPGGYVADCEPLLGFGYRAHSTRSLAQTRFAISLFKWGLIQLLPASCRHQNATRLGEPKSRAGMSYTTWPSRRTSSIVGERRAVIFMRPPSPRDARQSGSRRTAQCRRGDFASRSVELLDPIPAGKWLR